VATAADSTVLTAAGLVWVSDGAVLFSALGTLVVVTIDAAVSDDAAALEDIAASRSVSESVDSV